jgi:5'-nucleotidase
LRYTAGVIGRIVLLSLLTACASAPVPDPEPPELSQAGAGDDLVTITVLGTNDIHGAVERLPALAGAVDIIREQRERTNGGVVLVDGGDMFQGTLESNLGEGDVVVEAMNIMGYAAAAVGNHEFDFGPVGEASVPKAPGDDPRGALKARAAQAKFKILTSNITTKTGKFVEWAGISQTTMVEVAGIKVGIIGISTRDTLTTTIAANVADLKMAPASLVVAGSAPDLRAKGASIVIVVAHAGGSCSEFSDPYDLSSCNLDGEVFQLAKNLPKGAVDVIVGGHTHAGVAHYVNGIAVVEGFAHALAFDRVDVTVNRETGTVANVRILPPHQLCESLDRNQPCEPRAYEGRRVVANDEVEDVVAKAVARAKPARERDLGVDIVGDLRRAYRDESALGNWIADLMLEARPAADVALTNGGGLRADLPSGRLNYGKLYRVTPFDNRFATVKVSGSEFKNIVAVNLSHNKGIFSLAGVRVKARCDRGSLAIEATRTDGRPIADDEQLSIVTSDFLATGGDRAFAELPRRAGLVSLENEPTIRDAIAEILIKKGGAVAASDTSVFDANKPRLDYEGSRPVSCK